MRGETQVRRGIALHAQNGEAFLRDARDGHIYLLPRGLLGELSNGKRLVDPRLHIFDSKEFDRIVVSVGGKKRELLHQGRENFSTEGYASAKSPDKRDQMAKNWHDSLWRTFPMEVLGKDELPKGGTLKPSVRVEYFEKGKSVGWLELARLDDGGTTSANGNEATDLMYARSEHTVGWTHLHSSDQIVTDAESRRLALRLTPRAAGKNQRVKRVFAVLIAVRRPWRPRRWARASTRRAIRRSGRRLRGRPRPPACVPRRCAHGPRRRAKLEARTASANPA